MNTIAVAVPLLLVAAVVTTVLALAGRESLRHQGVPVPLVRRPDHLLLLVAVGARALHRVSQSVVRPRLG